MITYLKALFERSPHLLGIFCVVGAVTTFSSQDVAIKWLSGDYPLHQIILARASVALMFTLGVLVPLEGGLRILRTKRLTMHLLRGLAVVIANMTFFTGLASLPLAEATAIFFVAPLFITVLSIPFLGEKVGLRRIMAVLVGLAGVAIMVRPGGDTFQWAAILPLAAALAYAMLQIMTRKLGMQEKAATMAFYIQLTFVVVCATIGLVAGDGKFAGSDNPQLEFLFRAWVWPNQTDWLIMVAVGFSSGIGGYLISQGYRRSEAALVAPFEYVALPMAVFWSIMVFGDWPDAFSFAGIALILSAGLYTFYRETVRGKPNVLEKPMPRNR